MHLELTLSVSLSKTENKNKIKIVIPEKVNWHLPFVKNGSLILPLHRRTQLF